MKWYSYVLGRGRVNRPVLCPQFQGCSVHSPVPRPCWHGNVGFVCLSVLIRNIVDNSHQMPLFGQQGCHSFSLAARLLHGCRMGMRHSSSSPSNVVPVTRAGCDSAYRSLRNSWRHPSCLLLILNCLPHALNH